MAAARGNALWALVALLIAAGLGAGVALVPVVTLGLAGAAVFVGAAVQWPRAVFVVLLLARFLSDYYTDPTAASGSTSTLMITAATLSFAAIVVVTQAREVGQLPGAPLLALVTVVAWVGIRSLSPESGSEGIRETGQWLTYLAVFSVAGVLFGNERGVQTIARVIVSGALFQCAFAGWELATGQVPEYAAGGATYLRLYGTFIHPGWLAFFLALALFALPAARWSRGWALTAGALILTALALTFARSPLVLAFLAAIFYGMMLRRSRVLVLAGVGAVVAFLIPAIRGRFLGEITPGGGTTGSYQSRSMLREYALDLWEQAPILGHGSGSFFGTFSERHFGFVIEAHSDILKLLADQGVVGLTLYLLAVGLPVVMLYRTCRPELLAVAAFLLAVPLMGVLDVFYRMNTGQVMLWALVGSAVTMAYRQAHETAPEAQQTSAGAVPVR